MCLPCALGGNLDAETIPEITASVVAGSANNQLATPQDGELLRAHGILYAPDYAINAGGIVNISQEGPGYDKARAWSHIARIADTVQRSSTWRSNRGSPVEAATGGNDSSRRAETDLAGRPLSSASCRASGSLPDRV